MARTLTARFVESVKSPASGRDEYADAALPSFGLRVYADGSRSFALRCRVGGRHRRVTWKYPEFKLAEAREAARLYLQAVASGEDPGAKPVATLPKTVDELADLYRDRYLEPHVRRWKAADGELTNHIRPHLGRAGLATLSRAHVREMLEAISAPVAKNRALMRLRAMLQWALGQDLVEADATAGLKRPTVEKPRQRVLGEDELRALWKASDALGYPAGPLVRTLILTGQRRDDVRLMHWREVDLDAHTWTIPGERYKGRRPHLVPLSDAVVDILEATPWADARGYVFSARGEGETPYANLVKPKARLDKESGVKGWVLHDLRRSCRTGLSRLGVPRDIAERAIGHAVGGRLGTTYDVHEYRDEKRAALDAWARYVLDLAVRDPAAATAG